MAWATSADDLERRQRELSAHDFPAWRPPERPLVVAGCFVCFPRGTRGERGERAWAAAVAMRDGEIVGRAIVRDEARERYVPGLLALREGPVLEAAVRALAALPECLIVNATGRDHPRRFGLALELGVVLGVPTVGVTDRPLVGHGAPPAESVGSTSAIIVGSDVVAAWLRTRARVRPLVVHAAHRTDVEVAIAVVRACSRGARTPEPLRQARRLARSCRASSGG